ncbi:hypothetical protein P280DRAFT_215033 [Massarina eburnea CBS 473.64]|uniref:DUF7730 domain-containing protein n=1 Tax=Massarina eburnea CBS 473.64 TaxID=1395130 RepID=A0A6A6S7Q8_9PLEO|nr:hypothetical protein P280DRAFT_215033 [Massarina eburnea CBS 473.64]
MKAKLSMLIPHVNMRWIPHDIENENEPSKPKTRLKSPFLLLAKTKRGSDPNHGAPIRRKSTLSLTSVPDDELDARTHMQGQSMFFAMLPIDVRKIVYEYVMGEETVHLTLGTKKRFSHFKCPRNEEGDETVDGADGDCGCKILVGGAQSGRLSSACLRLLMTCRRMYCEAIPHLYTPHIFSLLHVTHLLYLPSRVPQQRLNSIRSLRIRWAIRALPYFRRGTSNRLAYPEDTANWEKAWAILASMRGLKDLRVVIVDSSRDGIWEAQWLSLEGKLLEVIKRIKGGRFTEVMLPYASCRLDWDMGESGVVLRKPEAEVLGEEES